MKKKCFAVLTLLLLLGGGPLPAQVLRVYDLVKATQYEGGNLALDVLEGGLYRVYLSAATINTGPKMQIAVKVMGNPDVNMRNVTLEVVKTNFEAASYSWFLDNLLVYKNAGNRIELPLAA
jgi:hypothetical protein